MTHEMNLWHDSFTAISKKTKTIEMRLFDEKRSKINIGDSIVFTDTSNGERIECIVSNMYRYPSFEELYIHHDSLSIGYSEGEKADPDDMLEYYSRDMIEKYGVVGIELSSVKLMN